MKKPLKFTKLIIGSLMLIFGVVLQIIAIATRYPNTHYEKDLRLVDIYALISVTWVPSIVGAVLLIGDKEND